MHLSFWQKQEAGTVSDEEPGWRHCAPLGTPLSFASVHFCSTALPWLPLHCTPWILGLTVVSNSFWDLQILPVTGQHHEDIFYSKFDKINLSLAYCSNIILTLLNSKICQPQSTISILDATKILIIKPKSFQLWFLWLALLLTNFGKKKNFLQPFCFQVLF